jgi:hypothetical protein
MARAAARGIELDARLRVLWPGTTRSRRARLRHAPTLPSDPDGSPDENREGTVLDGDRNRSLHSRCDSPRMSSARRPPELPLDIAVEIETVVAVDASA